MKIITVTSSSSPDEDVTNQASLDADIMPPARPFVMRDRISKPLQTSYTLLR